MGLVCSAPEGDGQPPSVLFGEPVGLLRPVTQRLLERFTVQPYSVLGVSDVGPNPGSDVPRQGSSIDAVIVDATKTEEMVENAPFTAKGVSMSIYNWLGINSRTGKFPGEVFQHFEKADRNVERKAKYHRYSEGQHVIHAIGPRLRKLDQSLRDLIDLYANILFEFCEAIGPGPEEMSDSRGSGNRQKFAPRRLRLLPISTDGGVVTKELRPQMGRVFWSSIALALDRLPVVLQRRLESAVVEVCIYRNDQVRMFEDALREKWDSGGLRLGPEMGQLRIHDGGHDWVRTRNIPRDRFARLAAASATLRAVREQGYVLPDGRGVGLNHVNRMLSGTRIWRASEINVPSAETLSDNEVQVRPLPRVQACIDESATVMELATALARNGKRISAISTSSPHRPGGEIFTGECHRVEEEWCMTSTLLKSLQHAQYQRTLEARRRDEDEAPRARGLLVDGCVLSPMVEVFRDSCEEGYIFLSDPVTLNSVISIMVDPMSAEATENDVRRTLRNAISAATESNGQATAHANEKLPSEVSQSQVVVFPYSSVAGFMDNPIVAGTLLGEVLREPQFVGLLEEVVIVGNRLFAQAAANASRGEPPPEVPPASQIVSIKSFNQIDFADSEATVLDDGLDGLSLQTPRHDVSRSRWAKTPRHDSSEFLEKHYAEIRQIGRGAFGTVSLVREALTGDERVCKVVSTGGMKEQMVRMLKKEAELLCSLDHPGVVRLYEYAEDQKMQQLIMILEYVPGGGCDDLLAQAMGVPLSEPLVVKIVSQVLATMAYCHARGVVHRDVKPENIMLTCRPLWRSPDVKLIDFGAAASYEELKNEVIGTIEYMPPEALRGESNGPKADIWGLAASAFELLHGEPPFGACDDEPPQEDKNGKQMDGAEVVQRRILSFTGNFEDIKSRSSAALWHKFQCRNDHFWQRSTPEAQDFLRWLMSPDPAKRPSAVEALEHPWLEMHRPEPSMITEEMAISLASYVKAPKIVQSCMVIVAASLGASELEEMSSVFLSADSDCDGKLSAKELKHAMSEIDCDEEFGRSPVKDLLLSDDMGVSDGLGFTEFLAACLFGQQASLDRLIEDAFHVLDVDRDGFVPAQDTQAVFEGARSQPANGKAQSLLSLLPEGHSLSLEEWCAAIKASIIGLPQSEVAKVACKAQKRPGDDQSSPPQIRIRRRGPRGACC